MKTSARSTKLIATATAALLTAAQFAPAALAATSADQTRDSYVAAVEPICKTNTQASERLLGGVKKQVKEGKLKAASSKVSSAAASSGKTVTQLKQVAQPTSDAAKLGKWIGYLEKEQKLLSELSQALKKEDKNKVSKLTLLLTHNGNQANNSVLGFDFEYCLIPTDQF